jgi:hypothetical protein
LEELEIAYYDAVEPILSRKEVHHEVRRGIEDLERKGIIEFVSRTILKPKGGV